MGSSRGNNNGCHSPTNLWRPTRLGELIQNDHFLCSVVIVSYSARSNLPFIFPNMGAIHSPPSWPTPGSHLTPHSTDPPLSAAGGLLAGTDILPILPKLLQACSAVLLYSGDYPIVSDLLCIGTINNTYRPLCPPTPA